MGTLSYDIAQNILTFGAVDCPRLPAAFAPVAGQRSEGNMVWLALNFSAADLNADFSYLVPGHEHGSGEWAEWRSLELQRDRSSAVDKHVKPGREK